MKASIIFCITVFLFFGCKKDDNPSANSNSNTSSHIYPLAIGNQWIYSVGDTITIDMNTSLNGKTAFHIAGDDDYSFGQRNLYYEGSMLYGWDGTDTLAEMTFDEGQLESLPKEKITVPAGTFDTYKASESTTTYWLAKGYGVIKTARNTSTVELVKYTIK